MRAILTTTLFLFLAATVSAADKTSSAGGTTVQILGRSGKMTISRGGGSPLKVTMDALREVDSAGNAVGTSGNTKHSFNTFASQDFTFSAATTVQYQNLTAAQIDFSCDINTAKFKVKTYVFEKAGTILNDGEASVVGNGTLKFNVDVKDWVWCNGANCKQGQTQQTGAFLDVDLTIQGLAAAKKKAKANPNLPAANQTTDYDLGGGAVLGMSNRVKVDGAWVTMAAGYPKMTSSGSKTTYTIRLPKGAAILYDPTISPTDQVVVTPSSASKDVTWSSFSAVLAALAVLYKTGMRSHA